MDVMTVASSIGLVAGKGGEVSGTIAEETVLGAISALADAHPGNEDLFADAAMRVELARSAGIEEHEANSVFNRSAEPRIVQLRYRTEMLDVFVDLAIDIGLRDSTRLADSSA